jgi:hypothetical protein
VVRQHARSSDIIGCVLQIKIVRVGAFADGAEVGRIYEDDRARVSHTSGGFGRQAERSAEPFNLVS